MKRVVVGSFFVSALATGILAYPRISNAAFWSIHSAAECNTVAGGADQYVDGGNNLSSNTMILYCAANDTSTQPRTSVTWVHVHVEDNSSSFAIQAARCVKFVSATGGACSTFAPSSGTGQKMLEPGAPAGWTSTNFGYIHVTLPPRGTGTSSKVNGYSMGN